VRLEPFFDTAIPFVKLIDAACVVEKYSQLRTFTQIAAESAFDPNATSSTGAIGLCQIEPATAAAWNCDPHDPKSSIDALVLNMAHFVTFYAHSDLYSHAQTLGHGPFALALAAYNAGPGAVDHYENVPPYPETQEYVEKITATVIAYAPTWPSIWKDLLARATEAASSTPT